MKILVRREVVQRGTRDGLWLVVLGDPGRDPARIGRGTTPEEATATAVGARPRPEATADEVVHLPLPDELLEGLERDRIVRSHEAADRHDRLAGGQLEGRRLGGRRGRADPAVLAGAGLEPGHHGAAHRLRAVAASEEPASSPAGPAVPPAAGRPEVPAEGEGKAAALGEL